MYSGKLITEVQTVLIGNQFTGVAPNSDRGDRFGVRRYYPATAGGLLNLDPHTDSDFDDNDRVRKVTTVKMKLGGPTQTWSISVASPSHPDIVWISGTTDTDFIHDEAEGVLHLAPNESLKLVTANSNVELCVHVIYQLVGDPLR